jgi:glycosyltransferase involved in cell wall biosynthesis
MRRRLLCVADAGPRKNVRRLVQAFALFRRHHPNATLTIVGPGLGQHDPLPKDIASKGTIEGVVFRGELGRTDLSSAFAEATLFIHPSLEETFGYTVVEAMQAGLPVVAGAKSGAMPWLLDNGHCGHLCDVKSPQAMVDGLLAVQGDPSYAEGLVRNARARLQGELSSASSLSLMERHLAEVIAR